MGFDLSVKNGALKSDSSGNMILRNTVSDGDILFYVNDNGTDTKAMTIDGATAEVTLHKDINFAEDLELLDGKKLILGTGLDGEIYSSSDDVYIRNVTEDKDIILSVNDGGVQTSVFVINADDRSAWLANDDSKLYLGASKDSEVNFDGTDLIVRNLLADSDIKIYGNDGSVDTLMMTFDASVPSIVIPDAVSLNIGTGLDADLSVSSDDFLITNNTADKDIIFNCNVSATPTVFMTLDGSAGTVIANVGVELDMTATTALDASGATITNFASFVDGQGAVVGATMTADPAVDAEAGYIKVDIGGTAYQIPVYAA